MVNGDTLIFLLVLNQKFQPLRRLRSTILIQIVDQKLQIFFYSVKIS